MVKSIWRQCFGGRRDCLNLMKVARTSFQRNKIHDRHGEAGLRISYRNMNDEMIFLWFQNSAALGERSLRMTAMNTVL
jgi:hypothetical protein